MSFIKRIHRFQKRLEDQPTLVFLPLSADLQYLTGIQRAQPTYGAVEHPGDWAEGLWMTDQCGPILALTRMTAEFSFPGDVGIEVRVLGDWADPDGLVAGILRDINGKRARRVALGEGCSAETMIFLQSLLPEASFVSATKLLSPQRMIKSAAEIAKMRKAGEITEAAFAAVLEKLKPGITELEVASEVDYQLRRLGSMGSSFNTTLYAVGPQHEILFGDPGRSWPRALQPPVAVLFDFGAIHDGYCYDYGRTVSFGEPSPEMQRAFDLVMASQATGIAMLKSDQASAAQVDQAARQVIEAAGLGEAFRHRLGHGIGLDVHEPPFLTQGDETILKAGMMFTVEPSILVPSGDAARVEDVVLVGEDGGLPLTADFQTLTVIE